MSSIQPRVEAIRTRLAAITDTTANLEAQLCELNTLRGRIRKAQVLAQSYDKPDD